MPFLVRKIERGKWMQTDICNGEDVSADAITNCMKTTKNALSTWYIENETQIDEAVLAIVSNQEHLDSIDVVLLSQERLLGMDISIEVIAGITPILSLVDSHRNVVDLKYKSIGKLAGYIVESFKEEKVKRYTVGMLKKLLQNAIVSGKLKIEAIVHQSLSSKLC